MAEISELRPYVSMILANSDSEDMIVKPLIQEMRGWLTSLDGPLQRKVVQEFDYSRSRYGQQLSVSGIGYSQERTPPWINAGALTDTTHHLILVCQLKNVVAIHSSDSAMTGRITRLVGSNSQNLVVFAKLTPIEPQVLNALFLQDQARTIWMSGLHRPAPYKADSKVLVGTDVAQALNPFGDQTYCVTAARSTNLQLSKVVEGKGNIIVGVRPQDSRVWIRPSQDWDDFCDLTMPLLDSIQSDKRVASPFQTLATPAKVQDLADPYDISVVSPFLLHDADGLDEQTYREAEMWAEEATYEIADIRNPHDFDVSVTLNGDLLGELSLKVRSKISNRVEIDVSLKTAEHRMKTKLDRARVALRRAGWLTIRFDNAHTISNGEVFLCRIQDRPFTGWAWHDFCNFETTMEKPLMSGSKTINPSAVGLSADKSLFSWVVQNWTPENGASRDTWLACDDGPGEVADFVFLDKSAQPTQLALIHVKGAKPKVKHPQIAVSSFEIVVSQAIKNIRYLDPMHLASRLADRNDLSSSTAAWHNGHRTSTARNTLIDEIKLLDSGVETRVIIVQPSITETTYKSVRDHLDGTGNDKLSANAQRLRQLDALLLEAEATCRDFGAEFEVIGSADSTGGCE